jgi:hypothetical protein
MSPRPAPPDDVEGRIDGLFALPLDRFVQERNALAADLRRDKRIEEADRVKGLARPALPAWALNQVYWHARKAYERLTAAGDRLRELQRQALAGRKVDLDEATRERQEAIRQVVERAAALMTDAGQAVTDATRQRIAVSADAMAAYGSRPSEYVPGRLEKELQPPGFEALAGLTLGGPLRLVKSEREARGAPAAPSQAAPPEKGTREQARARAAEAREAERQRREALKEAKQDRDARERDVERARRAESDAGARLAELRREADARRRQLEAAEESVREAERVLEAAREEVRRSQDARRAASERVRELER